MVARSTALGIVVALAASAATAEGIIYDFDGSFDDATFSVETAIVDAGLVIDNVSHVGDMLNRTAGDVGSDVKIFEHAYIYTFCSALLSRKVMEADPSNVVYCPYSIYVAEREGAITIGHRDFPEGPMKEVEAFLGDIVHAAME